MTPKELEHYRDLLQRRRDELRSEGDLEIEPGTDGEVVEKPDEDGAPLTEMNQVIASNRNRARVARLAQIEAALQRLGEDPELFGACEDCDEPIGAKRLELMPWVRLCIQCAQEHEKKESGGIRRHLTDYR